MNLLLRLLCASALLLMACAPAASGPEGGGLAAGRTASGEALPPEWEETLTKAKQEGKVVIVMGGAATRTWRPLFQRFQERFGIQVEASGGSGRESADRFLAERQAGVYSTDIWMTGLTTTNSRILPAGGLDPFEPNLILPEVKDKSKWYKGQFWFGDPDKKFVFLFNASPTPDIGYNTNLVKPDEISSVFDLLNPKWKGKFAIIDPAMAGVGAVLARYHYNPKIGTDFVRRFIKEQEPTMYRDLRQAAEAVAQGKHGLFIWMGSARIELEQLKEQGLPVDLIYKPMKEMNDMSAGGSGTISIVNKAPHPNAAKVFVNWALSKEGQDAANEVSDSDQSLREDVGPGNVKPEYRRQPGIDYSFYDAEPKFQEFQTEVLKINEQILIEAGRR